jgi:MarR family transcriptional regulator, organic hydroperoxide resistance regulator
MTVEPQVALDPESALELEQQVCFSLSVAARNVVAVYKPLLEPLGLTHPQYLVMLALWQYEPVSVRQLSDLLQLDPGTLSPLLKRLESSGLLRRARNAEDERSLAVTLTEKGRALKQDALKVPPAVVARLGMNVDELVALRENLKQVIGAAQAAITDAHGSPSRRSPSVRE